jgi:hypothetical protein
MLIQSAVESALNAIKVGTESARDAAKSARDRWHDYLRMIEDRNRRGAAADRYFNLLIDRVEEEALPRDGY